jgi:hypothetical protein
VTRVLLAAGLVARVWAQNAPPQNQSQNNSQPQTGSVSGIVRDASTNLPIPDVTVGVGQKDSVTDANGHYALHEIRPGPIRVYVVPDFRADRPGVSRNLILGPGQDLTSVDILIRPLGEISGKVVDQNNEPAPDLTVSLVARQYWLGALRYNFVGLATTDDEGNYVLQRVEPGRAYLVMVHKRDLKLEPVSSSPANPKLRRPAWVPTYFPGTPSVDGAQSLTLTPGERRQGINIQMLRGSSYCIEGIVQAPLGGGPVKFQISEQQPTYGTTGDAGTYGGLPGGNSGDDGKMRICNLHPGEYRLEVSTEAKDFDGPPFYGTMPLFITDQDLDGIVAAPMPRIPVTVEVVWDGDPPKIQPTTRLNVNVTALTRTEMIGDRIPIPGSVALKDLAIDDYHVEVLGGIPTGVYVKDITYGDKSVLHQPLRPGTASGQATLRMIVAANGGRISAMATDKDGNPVPDAAVVAFPEGARSDVVLADAMLTGRADQNGTWSSAVLAPGKYEVIALNLPPGVSVDRSPESLAKLLRARGKAQEIDLAPSATAQITIVPITLD